MKVWAVIGGWHHKGCDAPEGIFTDERKANECLEVERNRYDFIVTKAYEIEGNPMKKARASTWGLLFPNGKLSNRTFNTREDARFYRAICAIGNKPSVVRVTLTTWGRKGQ